MSSNGGFEERVRAHLAARAPSAKVHAVRKIGGGASRETWLVELDPSDSGLPDSVLVRKDTPFEGVVPTTLRREHDVLVALAAAGIRVPRPLWYGDDTDVLGAEFYVRTGYEGTSDQRRFSGESAERLSRELATALAELHQLDPRETALPDGPAPTSITEATQGDVERWYGHWQATALEPMPLLEEVSWWLRRHVPEVEQAPVIVWGDVGIANTICSSDGQVLALSDWELAAYGDPMRDLASGLWRGVGRLAGKEAFLTAYEEAGGYPVDHERLRYFDVLMSWLVAIFTHGAAREGKQAGERSLHPPLLSIWAQRVNLEKAAHRIGLLAGDRE